MKSDSGLLKRTIGKLSCVVLAGALCCSCFTGSALDGGSPPPAQTGDVSLVAIGEDSVPLAAARGTKVLTPGSPGTQTFSGGGATIDASNTSEGYVMVQCNANARVKVLISRSGDSSTYQYNLNNNGVYEVLPLTCGNGEYRIGVYRNVSGDQYAEVLVKTVRVSLRSDTLPFLYPSQYVNFTPGSKVVAKGQELASGAGSELDVVANVYNYVIKNITYDTYKAQTVQSGYLPNVDSIMTSGKGICFDYAAVMAAMLRSQQIPTRLEIGYVSNGAYHAWISTYITDVGWVNGIIQFDGVNWKLMDPTFASSGGENSSIMQYIGNGTNYRRQYVY